MRLKIEQLDQTLKKNQATVYLVSGDEPLQLSEAGDAIRLFAKKAGYHTREIFSVETGFVWNDLVLATRSIFADKKLIELRMSTAKPGVEGAKALTAYCQRLPSDVMLLITLPRLDKSSLNSKWFQSIEKIGVTIQVWALDGVDLIRWIQQRAQKKGLRIESDGIKNLAAHVEGNLLAAAQEIETLYVLYGKAPISKQMIEKVVTENSCFDVFKLTDCVLSGNSSRTVKVLNSLKTQGVVAPIILWALTREARMLINIKQAISQGQNREVVFRSFRLWGKHKELVAAVVLKLDIQRLQKILLFSSIADRQIKGQQQGDYWETLLSLCLLFSIG